jgi:TetR/AcrR family transcriptional regulator
MASRRRLGQHNSATRAAILEAAAKVLLEEGVTKLTSRRISQKAGIKSQLVHYYFRTMEDLTVALMQREGDDVLRGLARAAASDEPLRAFWQLELESRASTLITKLIALATHRERIRDEAIRYAQHGRGIQAEAIARHLELRGVAAPIPPTAIAFFMSAVARNLVHEQALGMSLGHREVVTVVEEWLSHMSQQLLSRSQAAADPRADLPGRSNQRMPKTNASKRAPKASQGQV